ncbi:DUF6188 family protein [Nocardia thailandica]
MKELPIVGAVCAIKSTSPILVVQIDQDRYQLMAESGVVAVDSAGRRWEAEDPADLGDVLVELMDRSVVSRAAIAADGTLSVRLRSGVEVSFLPDPDYESWWIAGIDGFRVVCTPGGKLVEWDPDDTSRSERGV